MHERRGGNELSPKTAKGIHGDPVKETWCRLQTFN